MKLQTGVAGLLLVFAMTAGAQQIHSATGPAARPLPAPPKPAHNSMARSTTPFNCAQYRWPNHPHPGFKSFCDGMEANALQGEAQRAGRPGPSTEVATLPPLGSAEAKQKGVACVGGQAMRRLANGWEQVSSPSGGWLRCRER
ncbi:hypothetical protein [Stenotrophomonas sp. 24(2023)]|uniref:hypothetical protein n=1 Tax=Stenotrophomonas sp. 24(2023) TaxID=3068324 RepID=UPI0027E147A4|nr:hypothetical protein [Stenotrophomonas sp. 24(2023)]WMJ69207.1 hypothetical protein Q9R17_18850 [Stenotrophomonas sp. 24(2023)]